MWDSYYEVRPEELHNGQNAATPSKDDEDVGHMGVESLLHHEETAVDVDLLDNDPDVCDLKQVLSTSRSFKHTFMGDSKKSVPTPAACLKLRGSLKKTIRAMRVSKQYILDIITQSTLNIVLL